MATWQERLAARLNPQQGQDIARLQEQVGQLEGVAQTLISAYQAGQFEEPPEELVRKLREQYDPAYVDMLMSTWDWELVGGQTTESGEERQTAVNKARRMWKYSELAQCIVWTWTAEGLGDGIQIVTDDDSAQETIDEFWNAPRNAHLLGDDKIADLSNWLLVLGNRFLAFYASTVDGLVTIRAIPESEITEIICNPQDNLDPWFYKRDFQVGTTFRTWYYPATSIVFDDTVEDKWQKLVDAFKVPAQALRADLEGQNNGTTLGRQQVGTVVSILHVAHNIKDENSMWGWPVFTAGQASMRMHKLFLDSALSVALAKAQYVRSVKVAGGSRAVDSVIDVFNSTLSQSNYTDTNPPPAAGSTLVHNRALDVTENPMTTGASDTEKNNRTFSWTALLGGGLFQATAGLDVARYATALTMDRVQSFKFKQYSTFWSTQFQL